MLQEQRLQQKMKFLLGYNMKIVIWCEWHEPLVGEGVNKCLVNVALCQ